MSIWTCRSVITGAVALALAACAPAQDDTNVSEDGNDAPPRPNVALLSAEMGRGSVKLTPPEGFCIDKRELRQMFAVLARCDSLGGKGAAQDAPLGLITVSLVQSASTVDTASAVPGLAPEGSAVLSTDSYPGVTVIHVDGDTPAGTDRRHWRGLTQIGDHVMALGAYGPKNGRIADRDGGALLADLAQRTQDASVANAVARQQDGARPGLGAALSGLFDRNRKSE